MESLEKIEDGENTPEWVVALIVGLATAILGFIGGFFTKTYQVKIKQKAKGKNINQKINGGHNG